MDSVTALRRDSWKKRLDEKVAKSVTTVRKDVGFDSVVGDVRHPIGVAFALVVREWDGGILFPGDLGEKTAEVYGAIAALGHPRFGYLDSAVVGEESRRTGVGTRLLTHVARQLYFDGVRHLVVRCPSKDRDWLAPALERRGFALEHRYARDDESFYGRNVTGWNFSSP